MKKRLFTIILLVLLMFSVLPIAAFADVFVDEPANKQPPKDVSFTVSELTVTPYSNKSELSEEQQQIMEQAYTDIKNASDSSALNDDLSSIAKENKLQIADLAVSDLFELNTLIPAEGKVEVSLSSDNFSDFVALLRFTESGWEIVKDASVNGKTLTFPVTGNSPFAVVVNTNTSVVTDYFGGVVGSVLSIIFVVFAIAAVGYLIGGIKIKGISLGTAGVLLIALLYGILAHYIPSFRVGHTTISLFNSGNFSLISNIGTALFVTAVGLIAGPKFFRTFNRKSISYIVIGIAIILSAGIFGFVLMKITGTDSGMMTGLLTGALTSTPGLSAAKESAVAASTNAVTAGYGIAYIFGVLGVVFFVQLVPKFMKVDIAKERESFVAANAIDIPEPKGKRVALEPFGFLPFFLAIALGVVIGAIKIPGINFSLGTSGGTLVSGLILGHFGHIGVIDLRIKKETLNFFRELGLVLFLVGAGVPGGVSFVEKVGETPLALLYGAILTLLPMFVGFLLAKYVFKLSIFNCLGSITGGMTSTPALGALIATAGTDDVASAYAATYPIALVAVVIMVKILVMF